MFLESGPCPSKRGGKFRPAVGGAHIDDADGFKAWSRSLDTKQMGLLAAFYAMPKFLLCNEQEVLVQGIGEYSHLNPLAAARDDRQYRDPCVDDPHIVLELGHMLFRCPFLGESPWQHEFGFKYRAGAPDHAVQGRRHPSLDRVEN